MDNILFSVFPNENFIDLGLYQFGWENCAPCHSYGPAVRNHFLFHYVISGTGILMADDSHGNTQTYHIKSGQGFMIFPDQINTYIADEQIPWEYTWLEFDGVRAKEAIEIAGLTRDTPVYKARSRDLRDNMFKEMMYIVKNKDASSLHLIGHLYLFMDYLTRSAATVRKTHGGRMRDFYIKEALSFIEQNFQNNISVEDIASFCGLNRSYFGKIFRESLGKSPQDFLMNYRMIKATELLRMTQLSIGDISKAVGYENQLHFSRAFKNIYGSSPRNWRDTNRILP